MPKGGDSLYLQEITIKVPEMIDGWSISLRQKRFLDSLGVKVLIIKVRGEND